MRLFSEIKFLQSETCIAGEFQLTVNYPEYYTNSCRRVALVEIPLFQTRSVIEIEKKGKKSCSIKLFYLERHLTQKVTPSCNINYSNRNRGF